MIKQFLVQIELDERVRLQVTDDELKDILKHLCKGAVRFWSDGSVPAVEVHQLTIPIAVG